MLTMLETGKRNLSMKANHDLNVPGEPAGAAPGVTVRCLIAQSSNAGNPGKAVDQLHPCAAARFHAHAFKHEAYILGALSD